MAGLGMAILGGALEQVGTGIADRGKALREAKLKELEQEREFQFRSREAGVSEDRADARALTNDQRQAAENQKSRDAQAVEGEKNRDAQKTVYGTDADGNQIMIRGDTATPVKGADGKPVKMATKSSDTPADQQMVEYLMKLGKTQDEALNWVKTSRGKSDEDSKLSLYKSILTANGGDSEAAQKEADAVWEKYGNTDRGGKADPYSNDRTAPEGPSKVIKDKPGALRAPLGDGTQDRPFKAAKQADIDWFKKYAKDGQMIEYGGTIYTK